MLKLKIKSIVILLTLTIGLTTSSIMLQPSVTAFAGDATGTTATFSDILSNQLPDGGWKKTYTETAGDWAKSTIDNKATYSEIRRLASEYIQTKDSKYSDATIKGINFLLNMQYDNGGWPQVYQGSGYHQHITYNDDAMINVMILLDEIANKKGNFSFVDNTLADKCKTAVDKGVSCLLKTQVISNGKLTVWGQQHDEITLKPAAARAYEVPSLCAKESATIVKFLQTRPATTEITASIKAATEWFNTVKITGIKIVKTSTDVTVVKDASETTPTWARFYELETNTPIFVGRDTIVKYNLSEIEQERRTGYSWYGKWASTNGIIKSQITTSDEILKSTSPNIVVDKKSSGDNVKKVTGWSKDVNGKWSYLSENGVMKTGWLKDTNEKWYYLNDKGFMMTGWLNDSNGKWYYLNASGDMAVNTTIDGYEVDSTGAWIY